MDAYHNHALSYWFNSYDFSFVQGPAFTGECLFESHIYKIKQIRNKYNSFLNTNIKSKYSIQVICGFYHYRTIWSRDGKQLALQCFPRSFFVRLNVMVFSHSQSRPSKSTSYSKPVPSLPSRSTSLEILVLKKCDKCIQKQYWWGYPTKGGIEWQPPNAPG